MKKSLILICALVVVAALSAAAYAEVQNVKVSGDVTAMEIYRKLRLTNGPADAWKNTKDHEMLTISRVRFDADLTDNVGATVRFLNERYWGSENETGGGTGIDLDLAYVTLKQFLYDPFTLTVGRQELMIGSGMILGDPDTNGQVNGTSNLSGFDPDLSARKAFDALRLTMDYSPLVIDFVAAQLVEGQHYAKDDTMLYGVNASYKFSDKFDTMGEVYLFQKRVEGNSFDNADTVNTVGTRIVTHPIEKMTYTLEPAFQFGNYNDTLTQKVVDRKAWALETSLNYIWDKVKFTPSTTLLYAYFSGNDNPGQNWNGRTGRYGAWDAMYENQTFGHIANSLLPMSNLHVIGGAVSINPMEDLVVTGELYGYWWDKQYGENESTTTLRGETVYLQRGKVVGQEIDGKIVYNYTEDVEIGLLGGIFLPAGCFVDDTAWPSKKSNNTLTEVIASMKVSF